MAKTIKHTNNRFALWCILISAINYDVLHQPGKTHQHADCLSSRTYLDPPTQPFEIDDVLVQNNDSNFYPLASYPASVLPMRSDDRHTHLIDFQSNNNSTHYDVHTSLQISNNLGSNSCT